MQADPSTQHSEQLSSMAEHSFLHPAGSGPSKLGKSFFQPWKNPDLQVLHQMKPSSSISGTLTVQSERLLGEH